MSVRDIPVRKFLVGVFVDDFCDQDYLRDRDETIFAPSKEEAKEIFIKRKEGWLRDDEHKYIRVIPQEV